jgi:hypothetical protein
VIDPTSLSLIRRFPVRMGMNSIKVDPMTDLVYLGRKNDVVLEVCCAVSVNVVRQEDQSS